MVVGNVEDPLIVLVWSFIHSQHVQSVVRSFLKKKVYTSLLSYSQQQKTLKEYGIEGYDLGNRYEVLKQISEPPITVQPLQEVRLLKLSHAQGDDPDLDFLVSYRSLLVRECEGK